jgi:hypothetical protein
VHPQADTATVEKIKKQKEFCPLFNSSLDSLSSLGEAKKRRAEFFISFFSQGLRRYAG